MFNRADCVEREIADDREMTCGWASSSLPCHTAGRSGQATAHLTAIATPLTAEDRCMSRDWHHIVFHRQSAARGRSWPDAEVFSSMNWNYQGQPPSERPRRLRSPDDTRSSWRTSPLRGERRQGRQRRQRVNGARPGACYRRPCETYPTWRNDDYTRQPPGLAKHSPITNP